MPTCRAAIRLAPKLRLTGRAEIIQRLLKPHLCGHTKEHLWRVDLNPRANIIGAELVSIGTLDMTVAHPREIFAGALIAGASAIVLAHNHPSGDVRPSAADLRNFSRLAICGMLLGIEVRDQLIISEDQLFSLQASRQQREFPHGKGRSLLL